MAASKPLTLQLIKQSSGAKTDDEMLAVDILQLSWMGLTAVDHLDLFDKCREVYLQHNELTTLDADWPPNVEFLAVGANKLASLDGLASLRKLVVLDATDNAIEAIPRGMLPTSIRIINLKGNPITKKPGWKGSLVAMLPNVCCIDGVDIDRRALEAAVDADLDGDDDAAADTAGSPAAASLLRTPAASSSPADPFVTSPGALRRAAALASAAAAADDRSRPTTSSAPTPAIASAPSSTASAVGRAVAASSASAGAGDDSPAAALAATAAHYTARREALSTLFKTRIDDEMKLIDAMAEQLAADSAAELTAAATRLQSAHASVVAKMRARDAELDLSLAQAREAFAAVSLAAAGGSSRASSGASDGGAGAAVGGDGATAADSHSRP